MNNYEHLLAQDPIGAFDKINENYKRYFETAYKIADQEIDDERIDLLDKNNNLYKSPYVELLPEYNTCANIHNINELAVQFADAFGSEDYSRQFFEKFISKGLMDYVPYEHQVDMFKKVFCREEGRFNNAVITTGTGSGKTEAFLLPVLAQLFKEAKTWGNVQYDPNWYCRRRTVYGPPIQRTNDSQVTGHIPALRALIMYPMNALVEDQMARLRKALDSDVIRDFMDDDNGLQGNRIFFGSYNGTTIGKKNYQLLNQYTPNTLDQARQRTQKELNRIRDQYTSIIQYYNQLPKDEKTAKEEALYTSPRLSGNTATAEMVTRWDMQEWPPDIMITNGSMLSIMLMRKAEKSIIEKTKNWLAANDLPEDQREEAKKDRIFHIILDELHLYRDTAGSETACLIRMFLNAIGLPPVVDDGNGHKKPNPQLRVLASSASLGTPEETQKFMEEFFGVYNTSSEIKAFNIVPDSNEYAANYEPESDTEVIDYEKFKMFTNDFVTLDENSKIEQMNSLAKQFDCDNAVDFIHRYERTIFADFLNIGCKRGVIIDDLVFRNEEQPFIFRTKEALRGFLIFRGYADHLKENGKPLRHRLPRLRFHQFYKYIEGLWGELNPTIGNDNALPVQNLSYVPHEIGPNNRKVLELLRCECCGKLFIGGNRKTQLNRTYLTLNYPSLDSMPALNPTSMVQNKSYDEYALFWPSHIQETTIDLDNEYTHFTGLRSNRIASGVHAQWKRSYLDVVTGEIVDNPHNNPNLIEGFILEANGTITENIHALPCACPHCTQDYSFRNYTTSPIRSFRTGIERSNQLLSKELMYQLNGKSAKLIGFSDSRQDAAKQALDIETEQYRDMARMLFIQSIEEIDNQLTQLIGFIQNEMINYPRRRDLKSIVREKYTLENLDAIVDAIYDNDDEELEKYKTHDTIKLSTLIGSGEELHGTLLQKFIKLGINPAGPKYRYQKYYEEEDIENPHDWSCAIDTITNCIRNDITFHNINDADFNYRSVKNGLSSAVFANSFGRYMGVSTLDAGIGYICLNRDETITQSEIYSRLNTWLAPYQINILDFIDAYIRVLGDHYRYLDPDNDYTINTWTEYNEFGRNVKKIIDHFADLHNIVDDELVEFHNLIFGFSSQFVAGHNTILDFQHLSFKKLDPQSEYYICPRCGRMHPNKGLGFCTNPNCMEELSDKPKHKRRVDSLQEKHFISYDILKEPREPRRLHTEELTGQTDNIQERLLNFKNIILVDQNEARYRDGYERTKPIDMVNVTTTMEVGVDIGSLAAIFQGNMPPTRYNYQQRVGRGGRRGQAFCTAVTFCRGRSHDVYYYNIATEEIVGGNPAKPELSLCPYVETDEQGQTSYHMKLAIIKRVVTKEILHKAYENLSYDNELVDTCGEFGRVSEWGTSNKQILLNWIAQNENEIDTTIDYYLSQFNTTDIDITDDINTLRTWLIEDLVPSIDQSLTREADGLKGLAQALAELGYLPMYGMPSDSRNFYHGTDKIYNQKVIKSIDRPSDLAITEFAPGSMKTKDKGEYRSEALTLPMDFQQNGQNSSLKFFYSDDDPDPEKDALKDRYIITFDHDIDERNHEANIVNIEPVNDIYTVDARTKSQSLGMNQRLIVIPRAYRTYKVTRNNGMPAENSDKSSSFAQCQIWANNNVNVRNEEYQKNEKYQKVVKNVKLDMFGIGLDCNAEVWHINSNYNHFFRGKYGYWLWPNNCGNENLAPNFTFYSSNDQNNIVTPIKSDDQNSFEIALGARKATELISLSLQSCPEVLNLDIHDDNSNKSAIRAAFFSAAFLLQRCLADQLDVQPDEIEISDKISNDCPYPIIYLNDALPNGAGIVGYLTKEGRLLQMIDDIVNFRTKFMQSLIDEDHKHACRTACPSCLFTYNNRGYHHILDWRLGVGILRLMINPEYDFGFSENSRRQFPELVDFNELIVAAAKKANIDLDDLNWCHRMQENNRPGRHNAVDKIFYHPLWNKTKTIDNARNLNFIQDGDHIELYNTFNLLRSSIVSDALPDNGQPPAHNTTTTLSPTKQKVVQSDSKKNVSEGTIGVSNSNTNDTSNDSSSDQEVIEL